MRRFLLLSTLCASPFVARASTPEAEALFVRRIQPLLQQKCIACHGQDEAKIKAGYDLRTEATARKGGESGEVAIIPGQPEKSPLYLSIQRTHDDWEPMPPKENDKLTAEQIGWIKAWVDGGAPWPTEARSRELAEAYAKQWSAEDGLPVKTSGGLSADWTNRKYKPENLWAYQPLVKPEIPSSPPANPIDAFLAAKRPADLPPASHADRATLLRRATYDLLGLPPTPEETAAFLADSRPDREAFAAVVERLLASPHYGEQWGRHWLDVVRYADSSGFANDYARGNAWRYRDYVVRAFNQDKPYDQFIREQLAGDEIAPSNPELLVAAGFLRMGAWELTSMEVAKVARQRYLDDVTDITGQVFLGHMLQCARCHDHKFDPIPTRDYYSMQACFATTQLAERDAAFFAGENVSGFEEKKYLDQRRATYLEILQRLDAKSLAAADQWLAEKKIDPTAWQQAVQAAREMEGRGMGKGRRDFIGAFEGARRKLSQQGIAEDQYPPKLLGFLPEDFGLERIGRKGLERLKWEYDRYQPFALSVYDGRTPQMKTVNAPLRVPADRREQGELEETHVLPGGDPFSPTLAVTPAILSAADAVGKVPAPSQIPNEIEGRRLALANWIAQPQNPLTARVMVNRIWLGHFGRALAGNPNNFGATGKKPTHPELLDWLAATFVEQAWSIKAMHRLILASEAYQCSAEYPDRKLLAAKDPEGTSYAVFRPRRLTAEELRDSMLAISGELNPGLGGIPARPEINLEAALQPRQVMGTFAEAWQPAPRPEQRHRRSLYVLKLRGQRDPFMEVFNEPTPEFSCEAREASTVTPQVFSLLNSEASADRALAFAARLRREGGAPDQVIERAFRTVTGRPPRSDEAAALLAHWKAMTAHHQAINPAKWTPPREVIREAVEENTGEKFRFAERLTAYDDFVPDLKPADVDAETRGLAEVCLVLFNSNEFAYVY